MIHTAFPRKLKLLVIYSIFFIYLASANMFAQIVTNGGFENSSAGIIDSNGVEGWLIQVAAEVDPAPVFEIVSDDVHSGNNALKVAIDGTGSNQWDIQIVADSIPVEQSTQYYFSVWAKSDVAGAQVNFTIGNYDYFEYNALRPVTLTTDWQEYEMNFTVTDGEAIIRAPIHFNYAGNLGSNIYLDDLKIYDDNFGLTPIVLEAENGELGADFITDMDGDITYVTTSENFTGLAAPEDTARMITYEVTFQDSGYYDLFVRLYVGSGTFDDDSFFAGRGFGDKADTASADWVMINGLGSGGFTSADDVVEGAGIAAESVWKWINATKNYFPMDLPKDSFYVSPDSLTKIFKIGSREDGLLFDKIAFGKSNIQFTVDALDNVLPGTVDGSEPVEIYDGPPLAINADKFLGNVKASNDIYFEKYWNQLTPENEGKWASVASTIDTNSWNWNSLDNLYEFSKENNILFKFHTLIWGSQQPSWISDLDTAQQRMYIEYWIKTAGERYPDMDMVDVVNEALAGHNPPDGQNGRANYKEALGGDGETGWDWVINSFKLARKYIPNAKLILNDYGIINSNSATNSYLTIINLLNDRGLIDGIGVQGHRFEFESASTSILKSNLDKLSATGLPVYITEMDLGNLSDSGTPDDDKQLELYQKIFPVLWQHHGVHGITLWGTLEGKMWQSTCYLINSDWSWRPALEWIAQYVADNPTDVDDDAANAIPSDYSLDQNYPNPFNPTTNISYNIPQQSDVTLKIYDMLGREVAVLVNSVQTPGQYTVEFNAGNLSSGIYFYRIQAGSYTMTKKLMLLK